MYTLVELRQGRYAGVRGYIVGQQNGRVEVFFPLYGEPGTARPQIFLIRPDQVQVVNFTLEMTEQESYESLRRMAETWPVWEPEATERPAPASPVRHRPAAETAPAPEAEADTAEPVAPSEPAHRIMEPDLTAEVGQTAARITEHIRGLVVQQALNLEDFLIQVLQPFCNDLCRPILILPQDMVERLAAGNPLNDVEVNVEVAVQQAGESGAALEPGRFERMQQMDFIDQLTQFDATDLLTATEQEQQTAAPPPGEPEALGRAVIRKPGSSFLGYHCFWQEPPVPGRSRPHLVYTVQVELPEDHPLAGNGPIYRRYFEPDLEILHQAA